MVDFLANLLGQGGTYTSPQQAERARSVAAALMARPQASNWAEGLAALTGGFTAGQLNNRADAAEAAGQASVTDALGALNDGATQQELIAALSNPWANSAQSGVASALLGNQLEQQDPMYQMNMEKARLELEALKAPQPATLGFGDYPSDVQEYLFAQENPGFAEWTQANPSGVNVNVGGEQSNIGTIPPGYAAIVDPNSPAGYRFERIPGSAADEEAAAAAAAAEAGDAQTDRYGSVVTEDIGRALDLIEKDPTFTTGIIGQTLAGIGGTPANRVKNLVETVKSNVGFDRLQAMRDSSPTGGALGSVTERELSLLTSAIGSLEQSNNADDLKYNLGRVNKIYMDIIHGPGNWEPGDNKPQANDQVMDWTEFDW